MYKQTDTVVLILLIFAVFYLSLIQHYVKCLQFFMYYYENKWVSVFLITTATSWVICIDKNLQNYWLHKIPVFYRILSIGSISSVSSTLSPKNWPTLRLFNIFFGFKSISVKSCAQFLYNLGCQISHYVVIFLHHLSIS